MPSAKPFSHSPRHLPRHLRSVRARRLGWHIGSWLFSAVLIAAILFAVGTEQAGAAEYTPQDEKSVRAVVQGQLDAFAKDDARRAFSFAAPGIRKTFGNPAAFLAMVKRSYPVVYRPARVAFLQSNGKGDDAIQRVQMLDAQGEAWLAIYSLERQKDGAWRITGCSVVENRGRTA